MTERVVRDPWSPTLIAVLAACALALVLLFQAAPLFLLSLIGVAPLALASILAWFCYDLVQRRFRHALSIVAAVATAVSIVRCAPLIYQGKDVVAFYLRLPHFDQQVERARAHQPSQKPLQIVVYYQDRSDFVPANSFYYVVYDETDGGGPYKTKFWPYAASPTGVMAVDVQPAMHHLTGHYYDFTLSSKVPLALTRVYDAPTRPLSTHVGRSQLGSLPLFPLQYRLSSESQQPSRGEHVPVEDGS